MTSGAFRGIAAAMAVLVSTVAVFSSTACDGSAGAKAPGRLLVVATTGMIADVARNIAGPHAEVRALMGEGVDPHLYKPSPGDVRLLDQADLVLYNGLHLEGRMSDMLETLGRRRAAAAVAEVIDPAKLRSPPEFEGQHDPHVWFDVSLWSQAAGAIRDALIRVDPANGDAYRAAATKYVAQLSDLDAEVRTEIGKIPEQRRVLVTAHDAFGYFGRAYDIEVLAIQGISTDSEAGLKDINALVDTLIARSIPAVFIESSVPRKTIDALIEGARARGHTVVIGGELYSDAMGADGTEDGTYIGMVRHNVRTIVSGLSVPASRGGATP